MGVSWTLPILRLSVLDYRAADLFVVADTSTYAALPEDNTYVLRITPPGYNPIAVTFTPGQINIYTCAELGITCSDTGCTPLPDGIWDITYTVQPPNSAQVSIDLKFIKIDTIRCNYQKAYCKVDLECGCHQPMFKKYMEELKMIKVYVDGAVAEANKSNYRLSYEYYHKADTMLDKLGCKFPNSKWKLCNCH